MSTPTAKIDLGVHDEPSPDSNYDDAPPLPAKLHIDLNSVLPIDLNMPIECSSTPRACPASPLSAGNKDDAASIPVPPPPADSVSAPAAFRRSKFRTSSAQSSALPSRHGSPVWSKPAAAWGRSTAPRHELPLYTGKENERRGTFGPGMYDVKCSKTGSPTREAKRTPRFAGKERFDRTKCYEGKENAASLRGKFGPGMYDPKCSKTGSPLTGKGSPRFAGTERFNRTKCYEGKENVMTLRGRAGASGLDSPRCSNRGSPLWKSRPSAAFAVPFVPKLRCIVLSARDE